MVADRRRSKRGLRRRLFPARQGLLSDDLEITIDDRDRPWRQVDHGQLSHEPGDAYLLMEVINLLRFGEARLAEFGLPPGTLLVGPHDDWVAASRQLAARIDQLAALPLIGATSHTFVICGWVPARALPEVRSALAAIGARGRHGDGDVVVIESMPEDSESPPILLDNPPAARPFELFVRLLSLPVYGGFDPTLLMSAMIAVVAFCLCSSAAYCLNDLFDLEFDRVHQNFSKR